MSDPTRATSTKASPPPAPPLPAFQARRTGVLQRLVETVGFGGTSRPPSRAQTRESYSLAAHEIEQIHGYQPLPSQTTTHRTGIPIAALDINSDKTHAVLGGKEILKTVRFEDGTITEDVNLRSNISSTSTASEDVARKRRDYLPATDVKWSKGNFENFIATAANHGRIALYDVSRAEVERAWLHEHTGPVHKLAFDPHIGALLLSGSHDGSVKMWDLRTLARANQSMKSVGSFLARKRGVRDVKWCPTRATDALEFALCTETGIIQKWDLRKPNQPVMSINAHGNECLSIDWHPDGKHLVSGGLDRLIKVWDFHNDKGNQKAKFEFKAPQAIRNIRWRPPCWSSEFAGTGRWQSTQLATSYHQDDPRVHIWDLRRQHLPFRELQRYRNAATDLLWANKDLIWTVGDEGWFTQTDVSSAPPLYHSIPPGTMSWFPEGEYAVFTEQIGVRRASGMEDPAVGFLSLPHEKLSSGEEIVISNSFSDDDTAVEGLLPNAFKRRQSRAPSAKSGKSQNNTPPTADGFPAVWSLDKALPDDLFFVNKQVGMVGQVTGLAADAGVVKFLAESYVGHSIEAERRAHPGQILDRLEGAFHRNADLCDEVSMHRTAQSWRMLAAVIVPELRAWADNNRAERLASVKKQDPAQLQTEKAEKPIRAPLLKSASADKDARKAEEARSEKMKENMFKGVLGLEKPHLPDLDSTSNVTTPMARPLPDSPLSDLNSPGKHYQNLDEALETLPQLPPSLLTSHTTAAAASRALRENAGSLLSRQLSPSITGDSDSSPSKPKHRRAESSQSLCSLQNLSPSTTRPSAQSQAPLSSPLALRPTPRLPPAPKQEDRRAALRDYQKQTRPLLTFEEPSSSPTPAGGIPPQAFATGSDQASSDRQSFPMFSTSDSSHGIRRHGDSTSSPDLSEQDGSSENYGLSGSPAPTSDSGAQRLDAGLYRDASGKTRGAGQGYREIVGGDQRRGGEERPLEDKEREAYDLNQGFAVDGAGDGFGFGMDGIAESHEEETKNIGQKPWDEWDEEDEAKYLDEQRRNASATSVSSSPHEPFQFDHESPVSRKLAPHTRNYNANPFARQDNTTNKSTKAETIPVSPPMNAEDLTSSEFVFLDFQPMDLTKYEPATPFAWSTLPLIAQIIAFDLDSGPACAQFSVHLLAHVHPYFFHQRYRSVPTAEILNRLQGCTLADRLMHPSLNSRIFETIFTEHDRYLKRMGLFVPMRELRKIYVDFDYPNIYNEDAVAIEAGLASATPYALSLTCANIDCRAPMLDGDIVCQRCRTARALCPICSALKYDPALEHPTAEETTSYGRQEMSHDRGLWAFCQGCGHSAHVGCMEDWLAHPFSEGECPTSNCGHDCGPGKARLDRVAAKSAELQDAKSGKPSGKGIEGDTWKVNPSAAVERTRKTLRSIDDRGTQSGDESGRVRSSFGSRSGAEGPGSRTGKGSPSGQHTGQRKSVRLITPHEEVERSMGKR